MKLASQFLGCQDVKLKPCRINNKSSIIYPKGLQQSAPDFFNKLSHFCNNKGIKLKEEQRTKDNAKKHFFERRCLMPVLIFSASLFFDNIALANEPVTTIDSIPTDLQQKKVELRLISNSQNSVKNIQSLKPKINQLNKTQLLKSHVASNVYAIFKKHYVKQNGDPKYIDSDLKEIANYYSHYPEAIRLITSIKLKKWTLVYNENIWSTVAKGRELQVNTATIHFNTRSAAKLKLHNSCKNNPVCIASPADALLHELLHTQSMLNNTEEFISQGGMNSNLYPWKHEYAIIKKENALYASMSRNDTHKRPQRNEHFGRKVVASCATCIK